MTTLFNPLLDPLKLKLGCSKDEVDKANFKPALAREPDQRTIFPSGQDCFHTNRLVNAYRGNQPLMNPVQRHLVRLCDRQVFALNQRHREQVWVDDPDGPTPAFDIRSTIEAALAAAVGTSMIHRTGRSGLRGVLADTLALPTFRSNSFHIRLERSEQIRTKCSAVGIDNLHCEEGSVGGSYPLRRKVARTCLLSPFSHIAEIVQRCRPVKS